MKKVIIVVCAFIGGCCCHRSENTASTSWQEELTRAKERFAAQTLEEYWKGMSEVPPPSEPGVAKTVWSGEKKLVDRQALKIKMQMHANNLMNVYTVAFKRSRANFADLFYQQVHRAGDDGPGGKKETAGIALGTGVKLVSTEKIFEQGEIRHTERDLDLAVDGEGFLRVRLPDQTIAFTRAGNLNIDSQGNLVTPEGYLLDPPITVPGSITRIFIDSMGLVEGFDPQQPQVLQTIGQLELTRFINPSGLEAMGDNLYRETQASGNRIDGQPGQGQGLGMTRQGFLEESNVNIEEEAVQLRRALALYKMLDGLEK